MPAAIIGGGIAAIGGIGSAIIGSNAQKKAAQQATDATKYAADQNAALFRDVYNQNKGILSPYIQSGYGANQMMNAFLGIPNTTSGIGSAQIAANDQYSGNDPMYYYGQDVMTMQGMPGVLPATAQGPSAQDAQNAFRNYMTNSDYGFQFGEGANALNSGYAARGTLQSGAALKAMEKYRQNLQSGYRNEYLGYLGNQQGVGLSAGNALAGVGTNYANQMGSNNNAAAGAAANAALARGQSSAQLWGGIGGALGQIGGQLMSSYR